MLILVFLGGISGWRGGMFYGTVYYGGELTSDTVLR